MATVVSVFLLPQGKNRSDLAQTLSNPASDRSSTERTRAPDAFAGTCAAKTRLYAAASKYSPIFALDKAPALEKSSAEDERRCLFNGINIDITGSERLFGGPRNLLAAAAADIEQLGFKCRAAVSPTLGSSWALSRFAGASLQLVEKKDLTKAVAPLPIAALRIPAAIEEVLVELNIKTIGELFKLSRKSLLSRFDRQLVRQIDRLLGLEEEPIVPPRFPRLHRARQEFSGGSTQYEAVEEAAKKLLREVLQKLAGHELPARLVLEVKTVSAAAQAAVIAPSSPTRDKKHLWRLMQSKLEKINLGLGVEYLTLSVAHLENQSTEQLSNGALPPVNGHEELVEESGEQKRAVGALLDVFAEQLGGENIRQLQCAASHLPEKAFSYPQISFASGCRQRVEPQLIEAERPSILFYRPQPIQAMAMLPDSPPFWLRWKGEAYRLTNSIGPERIAPQWWGTDESLCAARDYFKVQLPTGAWLWIFRDLQTSAWFVHGIWA